MWLIYLTHKLNECLFIIISFQFVVVNNFVCTIQNKTWTLKNLLCKTVYINGILNRCSVYFIIWLCSQYDAIDGKNMTVGSKNSATRRKSINNRKSLTKKKTTLMVNYLGRCTELVLSCKVMYFMGWINNRW